MNSGFGQDASETNGAETETAARLRDQTLHDFAVIIGEAEVAALVTVSETRVIDSELMQNRGLKIMGGDRIYNDIVAIFVGFAIDDTAFESAAGDPRAVTRAEVIAAVAVGLVMMSP